MAVQIIDADTITAIRAMLGVSATALPDATITSLMIGEAAETDILTAVGDPAYADRPADEQATIRRAIAYLTASYAVGTLRERNAATSRKFANQYTISRNPGAIDLDAWAASLRSQAYAAIDDLTTVPSVTHFGVACGRRGA